MGELSHKCAHLSTLKVRGEFNLDKKDKQIQRGQFDLVFVVEENACLSFCCQRLQKVVVAVSLGGKNILGKQSEIT